MVSFTQDVVLRSFSCSGTCLWDFLARKSPKNVSEDAAETAGSGLGHGPVALEGGLGELFSPLPPPQHHFSWQSHHPLFWLAVLLQAVCVKNHHFFFCQAVLTVIWS